VPTLTFSDCAFVNGTFGLRTAFFFTTGTNSSTDATTSDIFGAARQRL
jgi:hypothetical protein